jgi:hypothetical protein
MSHSRLLPNSYQPRPTSTNGTAPSYLTPSNPCQNCHRVDHVSETCPNRPRSYHKSQTGSIGPGYGQAVPTQVQRSYHVNGNEAGFQTWITPPSQYLSVPQPHQVAFYTHYSPKTYQNPSMVPDVEFPSLAGTSLAGSLLNSPLYVNPSTTFMSTFPVQPPPIQTSTPASLTDTSTQGQANNGHRTPLATSLPTKDDVIFGEEMSFFDQAMWTNEYDYLLMPNNGTSPTDYS